MLSGPELGPRSGKKAKQLVIFLHGVGADGNDLIPLAPEFADTLPDAHFIAPNGPEHCDMSPYGYQWFSLIDRNPTSMLEGVKVTTPIVNSFIDKKLSELELTDHNLALVGFSQGTMTSLFIGMRRKNPCAGILGYSGALIGGDSLKREIKSRPPVCLIHGSADQVVSFQAMGMAVTTLEENGIKVESHKRPGLGHGIDEKGIELGKSFLKNCFGI